MSFADDIMGLRPGTPELETLRAQALKGDKDCLKRYLYFSSWQGIQGDRYVPNNKKRRVFRALVKADLFEVELNG